MIPYSRMQQSERATNRLQNFQISFHTGFPTRVVDIMLKYWADSGVDVKENL